MCPSRKSEAKSYEVPHHAAPVMRYDHRKFETFPFRKCEPSQEISAVTSQHVWRRCPLYRACHAKCIFADLVQTSQACHCFWNCHKTFALSLYTGSGVPKPQNGETQCFVTFLTFPPSRAGGSSFAWLTLSSLTVPTTVAASVHKLEVWHLNFLRQCVTQQAPPLDHLRQTGPMQQTCQVIFSKRAYQRKRAPAAVCPDAWVPSGKKHAVFTPALWPINWKTSWPSETRQSLGFQPGKARKKDWKGDVLRWSGLRSFSDDQQALSMLKFAITSLWSEMMLVERLNTTLGRPATWSWLFSFTVNLFSSKAWLDMKIRIQGSCSKRCAVQVGHCSFPPLANEHQA